MLHTLLKLWGWLFRTFVGRIMSVPVNQSLLQMLEILIENFFQEFYLFGGQFFIVKLFTILLQFSTKLRQPAKPGKGQYHTARP